VKRLLIYGFLLVLLTGATWSFGQVRLAAFEIRNEGSDFVITWSTEIEEDVRSFEIQRRTTSSNDQFVKIHTVTGQGAGQQYQFRDSQVFKSSSDRLDYRLDVVYENGVREAIRDESMNFTSTAVRRTWGSLKAMFQ